MVQKTNDYQIKNLIKHLDKILLLENAALERLPVRIDDTFIEEMRERMIPHLKHTVNQKNKLEQMIMEFKKRYDHLGLKITQRPIVSSINNQIENSIQASLKPSGTKSENFTDESTAFAEEAEFAKIKQDYIIEYDELVAYETLIQIAETTEFEDKDSVIKLLDKGKQEEESMVYWFQVHAPVILDNLWPKMINNAMKRSQAFLMEHRNSKMGLIIMYADLVGSTKMSMTLPIKDSVFLIRAFTHELSSVIERYHGYVLKYSGDAVISFFPYVNNDTKRNNCTMAIECAKSIIEVIKREINSVLSEKYNYPELQVKIGIDEGENSFKLLDEKAQKDFVMVSIPENNWKYINPDTNTPYTIYRSIFAGSV